MRWDCILASSLLRHGTEPIARFTGPIDAELTTCIEDSCQLAGRLHFSLATSLSTRHLQPARTVVTVRSYRKPLQPCGYAGLPRELRLGRH
jgi:hypothetical protein